MITQSKELLTAREVAARIGVSLRTVWRWTETGDLPAPVRWGRNGRVVRWKAADIEMEQDPSRPYVYLCGFVNYDVQIYDVRDLSNPKKKGRVGGVLSLC